MNYTYDQLPISMLTQLSTLYSQSHRHYHNLNHINRCVAMAETIELSKYDGLDDRIKRNQLMVAIWFHDAIYNPYSTNNERNSADLMLETFKNSQYLIGGAWGIQTVENAILATAKHTQDQNITTDIVSKYMLDIDLMGLADLHFQYQEAGDNIRKEYAHLSDANFIDQRCQFLSKMLDRKRIFYTDDFYNKFEKNARQNMIFELRVLNGELL